MSRRRGFRQGGQPNRHLFRPGDVLRSRFNPNFTVKVVGVEYSGVRIRVDDTEQVVPVAEALDEYELPRGGRR